MVGHVLHLHQPPRAAELHSCIDAPRPPPDQHPPHRHRHIEPRARRNPTDTNMGMQLVRLDPKHAQEIAQNRTLFMRYAVPVTRTFTPPPRARPRTAIPVFRRNLVSITQNAPTAEEEEEEEPRPYHHRPPADPAEPAPQSRATEAPLSQETPPADRPGPAPEVNPKSRSRPAQSGCSTTPAPTHTAPPHQPPRQPRTTS